MKRIALIVSSTALLVAGSGVASAARSIILPYPAELMSKAQRLGPDTAYRLLNPLSQKKQTASYFSGAYVPGGSSAAVAQSIQRGGTPKKTKKTSRVTVPSTAGKVFDSTGGNYDPARSIYVPGPQPYVVDEPAAGVSGLDHHQPLRRLPRLQRQPVSPAAELAAVAARTAYQIRPKTREARKTRGPPFYGFRETSQAGRSISVAAVTFPVSPPRATRRSSARRFLPVGSSFRFVGGHDEVNCHPEARRHRSGGRRRGHPARCGDSGKRPDAPGASLRRP